MSNYFTNRQNEFFMPNSRTPRKHILTALVLVICILTMLCLCACDKVYSRVDDTIYLGQYPQSAVTDSSVTDALTALAGILPEEGENGAWTSYGYYVDGSVEDYMWYIDVEYESEKYRGVYFTDYRPWWTDGSIDLDDTEQDDNGYFPSIVYWFKYEPVKWRILDESGKKAFLLADIALDSQAYHIDRSSYTIDEETVYPNNYAHSTIRTWLNDAFYNTAFNDSEKEIILTTTVDNSAASTGLDVNEYACEDTSDKVFLLSYVEAMNCLKGDTLLEGDKKRKRQSSDYAKCQGVNVGTESSVIGCCGWWLRSPSARLSDDANGVSAYGDCGSYNNKQVLMVDRTCNGIVPALWITL